MVRAASGSSATLRLPERLTLVSSGEYEIWDLERRCPPAQGAHTVRDGRLHGVFCGNAAEAAAAAGADFLVLREVFLPSELAKLCRLVSVPVYARGLGREQAWVLGASGTNEINY